MKISSTGPLLVDDQSFCKHVTKTRLYNFDPLNPHIYIVKLGFTGVYIIFPFLLKNIDCGYSLELPRWGSSNKYPQSMFWAEIWKMLEFFIWFLFSFWRWKFSIYLNRRVFVMQMICCEILVNNQRYSFEAPWHSVSHNENMPIQIHWKFHHWKTENFQIKILIFFIFLLKT